MVTYEQFKTWQKYHKKEIIYATCLVVIFFVGFGTGSSNRLHGVKNEVKSSQYQNYTTKQPEKPMVAGETTTTALPPPSAIPQKETPPPITECNIKGTKSGIYHINGGVFYNRVTKPLRCFNTEAEAVSAGFRKSSR